MSFEVHKQSGHARATRLVLAHGEIRTPVFMPVGTYGVVKTLSPAELEELGSQIILGNTYHLYLRPGLETLAPFQGLHGFMGWKRPILTDSGGFQVFSLAKLKKIDEEGVVFQSPLNGDTIPLTPEKCAEIQQAIGSDIAMVLDECVALPNERRKVKEAMERSVRWARRFLDVPRREGQKIFGIVQGGTDLELRRQSLELTAELPVDGIAVGGLSVGEPHEEMVRVLESLAPQLPQDRPRYLMGVGTPLDLLEGVRNGIDMFDCVLPTRNARNGGFFTDEGLLNIRNAQYRFDERPIAEDSPIRGFSRAYLRHLFQIKEILGCRLATLHNLHYYHRLMYRMREAIESGTFAEFYRTMHPILARAYPGRKSEVPGKGTEK